MAVDVMAVEQYSRMQLLVDGVAVPCVDANFEVVTVESGDDVACFATPKGESYTFHAEVSVHGAAALLAPLRAFTDRSSVNVIERYYFASFCPDVLPILNLYAGRSVVTRATSFDLVTEARVVEMRERVSDCTTRVDLCLEEGAPSRP